MQAIKRGELNHQLGPYPLEQLTTWSNLSNCVGLGVLHRAQLWEKDEENELNSENSENSGDCNGEGRGVMVYPGMAEDIEKDVRLAEQRNETRFDNQEKFNTPSKAMDGEQGALWGDVRGIEATVRELVLQQAASSSASASASNDPNDVQAPSPAPSKSTASSPYALLTELAMDRSLVLETYVNENCGGRWGKDGLIGEVQVSKHKF